MQTEVNNAALIITINGRRYRRVAVPSCAPWGGRWEFEYKGVWHEVRNYHIKADLNGMANNGGGSRNDALPEDNSAVV